MGAKKNAQITVEQPEIEIVVRVPEQELAVISFFRDGNDGWDVLVGVFDPAQRGAIKSALSAAAEAVQSAAFRSVIPPGYEGGDNTPPF